MNTKLLHQFLSLYLSAEQIKELLAHPIKKQAWMRLFEGYEDREIEECTVQVYSMHPYQLPSIQEIRKIGLDPIDKTKYHYQWNHILEGTRRSLIHDEKHNLIHQGLCDEARLSLHDLGGWTAIAYDVDPKFLGAKQKAFIDGCFRYKEQLKAGLVKPLPLKLYEIKKPTYTEEDFLDKEEAKTMMARIKQMLDQPQPEQSNGFHSINSVLEENYDF